MAAIDKLYIHSYYDFDQLRKWAIVYYPELIFYFYDFDLTYEQYVKNKKAYAKAAMEMVKRDYKRCFGESSDPVINIIDNYKKTADYNCPLEQAAEEYAICEKEIKKTFDDFCDEYTFPVTNTRLNVDRKLKWICPVPCVREYLHEQCGVNPKYEWFYKIFWRGKKHFL